MLDRIVFAHDNVFFQDDEGRHYSGRGHFPWERYLGFARSITVAARVQKMPADASPKEFDLSSRSEVTFMPIPSLSHPIAKLTKPREARRLLRVALQDADALVARLPSEIGFAAMDVAEKMGRARALELVTCAWDSMWNYGGWQGHAYAPFFFWRTRRVVRRSPHVFYVTERFLQGRYPTRGHSIGVSDVEIDEPPREIVQTRLERIAARPAPFTIGLIGYLDVRFKGVHTAIEALAGAVAEEPGCRLRILGAGDADRWVRYARELGVENEVYFDGILPAGDPVLRWIDDLDLYIQPSYQEGLPRALVEAMSRACPCLGSTAGGIPELLGEDCLHAPGDAGHLGAMIVRAASDREWMRTNAHRNLAIARRYSRPHLEEQRTRFWTEFAATVVAERTEGKGR